MDNKGFNTLTIINWVWVIYQESAMSSSNSCPFYNIRNSKFSLDTFEDFFGNTHFYFGLSANFLRTEELRQTSQLGFIIPFNIYLQLCMKWINGLYSILSKINIFIFFIDWFMKAKNGNDIICSADVSMWVTWTLRVANMNINWWAKDYVYEPINIINGRTPTSGTDCIQSVANIFYGLHTAKINQDIIKVKTFISNLKDCEGSFIYNLIGDTSNHGFPNFLVRTRVSQLH